MNLPDGWMPLELGGERVPTQVQRLIDERAAADPNVAAHRGQIERQVASAIKTARSNDLSFAAILATFTSDGLPITASLALTRHRVPAGTDAEDMLEHMGGWRNATNTLIDVPFVGPVVRSASRERVDAPSGTSASSGAHSVEVAVFQYLLPLPGGHEVAVATGSTPTLPMVDVFSRLFDAIISTFQFVAEPDRKTING